MAAQSIFIPRSFLEQDGVRGQQLESQVQVDKIIKFIYLKTKCERLLSYTYYTAVLDRYNPACFKFMKPEEQKQLYFDLQMAYLLLAVKILEEDKYQKKENLADLKAQKKSCNRALSRLDNLEAKQGSNSDLLQDSPTNYLYLKLGQWLGEKIPEASSGKTKFIRYWVGQINDRRLYWVWGGGLLETVLQNHVADDFFNAATAKNEIAALHPVTGYLSFCLYYFRFGLNLSLLLKHTIKNPTLFQTQWQQRKFMLINDSVWATANLAGFFWLVGSTVKDHANNLLTVGLLLLDLSLAIWRYWEFETEHADQLLVLQESERELLREMKEVKRIIVSPSEEQSAIDDAQKDRIQLKLQIRNLRKDIAKMEFDWKYTKRSLLTDIAYAFGLLLSFTFMTIPFIPVAAPLALTFGIIGIAACFVLTSIYSGYSAYIEISKVETNRKEVEAERKRLLQKWPAIIDENEKKQRYLQRKDLKAEDIYAKKMIHYQSLKLARTVIFDASMPALIFAATVFMPMGIGIAIIAVATSIALISKLLLNVLVQPLSAELVKAEFDERKYRKFCHKHGGHKPGFFGSHKNDPETSEAALLELDAHAIGHST